MKKITKAAVITLSVLATLSIGGSIVTGGLISDKILHQNKDKNTSDNSIKQLEIWGYDIDDFNKTHSGTEITAKAEDGNTVPATLFDGEGNKCVILVHGAGGDRVCTYPLAEQYIEDGYDVIAIDQRGCGKNEDDKVTFGIHELRDVKAMVTYARETLDESEVIVHGQSMGAQTTALYAADVVPGEIDAANAVICDSPVPGMDLILRLMFGESKENAYSAMTNYLIFTSKNFMKTFDKVDFDDGDTIAKASEIKIPVMIIVSDRDEVCLPEYVEEIYGNITAEKRELVHVDSEHIMGVIDDPEGYMESVESFLSDAGL